MEVMAPAHPFQDSCQVTGRRKAHFLCPFISSSTFTFSLLPPLPAGYLSRRLVPDLPFFPTFHFEGQSCRARARTQQIPSRTGLISSSAMEEMDTCSACAPVDSTLSPNLWPSPLRIRKFRLKGIPREMKGRLWSWLDPCRMERDTRPPWMGHAAIAGV